MSNCFYIYLAGNIKKGKEDEHELAWTLEDQQLLQRQLPHIKLVFLNPATRSDDLSDQTSVFGRDLLQVFSSQLVLVDARGKRGLGVGAEMMFAKMNHIPVISWLPADSHYHRQKIDLLGQEVNDWIHPFVFSLSDYRAPSLESAAKWIQEELISGRANIKGPESTTEAMRYYLENQLHRDHGMKELISSHPHFSNRIECIENAYLDKALS